MVLSNLFILAEVTDLTAVSNEIVALFIGYFGIDITTKIVSAISGFLKRKRDRKVINFAAGADKSIKNETQANIEFRKILKKEIVDEVVTPLLTQNNEQGQELLQWKELAIIGLGLTPMPLGQKKLILEYSRKLENGSADIVKFLESVIANQEAQETNIDESNDKLEDDINKM